MKLLPRIVLVCAIFTMAAQVIAAPIAKANVRKNPDGATIQVNSGVLRLKVCSPRVIRVTYAAQDQLPELASLAVIGKPEAAHWKLSDTKDEIVLRTDEIEARVNRATGAVSFLDPAGHVLLREADDGRKITPATIAGTAVTACAQSFETAPEEGIYGLGQHQRGAWNYSAGSGGSVKLAQANTDVGVPVMTSSKGYVLLWDNPAVTTISSSAGGDATAGAENPALVVGIRPGHRLLLLLRRRDH